MVAEVLKPNVQDLQTDVIDLLERISELMNRASTALSSDTSGNKYAEFEQQIRDEAKKVKHLELRMAIVAPMKAGKSTITNAIIGQEILPSRNSAMTTLPTEIIFNAQFTEPVLHLSAEVLSVFQETLLALRNKIEDLGMETVQEKLSQYPHLANMPQEIKQSGGLKIPTKSIGRDQIIHTLTNLNDIVRLCSILEPNADPIQYLTDTPRIETHFWRLEKTEEKQPQLGNLVIVDTPGPNEAGENLRLQTVVAEQLRQSSIVLIVLDFTQLKNEAAEKVKTDVQKVIELRGKDNLYVLINKVDQRRQGDMTPEQVQQFVAAEFGIGDGGDSGRVFEISARRAFTAASFLLELQHNPNINIAEMKTAKGLAQEALGSRWEAKLQKAIIEDLEEEAHYLWDESGFDPFLNGAITALMKEATPRCMQSSLKVACGRLLELSNDVQLRSSAINADEAKIRQEVGALERDLQSIEQCRHRLQEVDRIKSNLYKRLEKILEDIQKKAQYSLKTYFHEEEYQRADNIKKGGIITTNFLNWASKKFNFIDIKSATSGIIEFTSMQEAEHFGEQAISSAKSNVIDPHLDKVSKQVQEIIQTARQEITNTIDAKTQPILDRAHKRLNENFNVYLSFPTASLEYASVGNAKVSIGQETKLVDQGYETKLIEKRDFFHYFFHLFGLVKKKEYISFKLPDKKEDYYTVCLTEIVDKSNQLIEDSIKNIKEGINQYLDEEFKQHIGVFLQSLIVT